ncbi:S-adenosyl-L-methionine-dependent methyltransferase [Halenospora varia]|nr:S-adenosyl-L-methionine-dependent methyltransferase [Halenospora varia]
MSSTENVDGLSKEFVGPKKWNDAAKQYNDAVIDLGAGTGSLDHLLAARYPDIPILATDISPGMLETLMSNATPNTKITTQVADMKHPIGGAATEGSFSHVFSTVAIQIFLDPTSEGILAEWTRLLKPDGLLAITIWDFDENCGPHAL